jgi:hypothetical protein
VATAVTSFKQKKLLRPIQIGRLCSAFLAR